MVLNLRQVFLYSTRLAVCLSLFLMPSSLAARGAPELAEASADKQAAQEPPVLDPSQFVSVANMAYTAAKICPQIIAHIFCYCGCDITDHHTRLLDCFTSYHGVDCHICQEEAMRALTMWKNGDSLAAIQKDIDESYASKYPFKEPSPALKKYLATRLWHPEGTPAGQAPADLGKNPSPDSGSCCKAKDKK